VDDVAWSVQRIPTAVNLGFLAQRHCGSVTCCCPPSGARVFSKHGTAASMWETASVYVGTVRRGWWYDDELSIDRDPHSSSLCWWRHPVIASRPFIVVSWRSWDLSVRVYDEAVRTDGAAQKMCLRACQLQGRCEHQSFHLRLSDQLKNAVFWNVTPCGSCE
jgi:hypothetical protein